MTLTLTEVFSFFKDDHHIFEKGEKLYNANHLFEFSQNKSEFTAKVHASMKNKAYDVKVRTFCYLTLPRIKALIYS